MLSNKCFFSIALFSAPAYCSKHLVTPQGWNYPSSSGAASAPSSAAASAAGDPGMEYIVDLGGHPPYHQPPEGFRLPHGPSTGGMMVREGGHQQGPFSSDSGSDADLSLIHI